MYPRCRRLCTWTLLPFLLAGPAACAFIDPFVLAAKGISISVDARTQEDVETDIAIETSCHRDLLRDEKTEWVSVTPLVFARHVVLVGAVKTEAARVRAEKLLRQDRRIVRLVNELTVIRKPGDDGSFIEDRATDLKINAVLTATRGIGSVNMRWKTINGRVILMGIAQSWPEFRVAVAKIKALDGVKSIKTYLRVVPPKKTPGTGNSAT